MLKPKDRRTEILSFRATPAGRRRLDAAADVAGVSMSRVMREGAMRLAREILREAAEDGDQ